MRVAKEDRSWKPRAEIDVSSAHDMRYWAGKFSVSEDALREAVEEVGPNVRSVATEFGCIVTDGEVRCDPEPESGPGSRVSAAAGPP